MSAMGIGDYVEVKQAVSKGKWKWTGRKGHITGVDRHCASVRTDDGADIRDVHEHFRPAERHGAPG